MAAAMIEGSNTILLGLLNPYDSVQLQLDGYCAEEATSLPCYISRSKSGSALPDKALLKSVSLLPYTIIICPLDVSV